MVHNLDVEPKRKKYKRSSTGYKGTTEKADGKFVARISIGNGKSATIGTFDTAIQAALAYDQAAIKKGFKKSRLNFPDDQQEKKEKKKPKKQKKELIVLTMEEYEELLQSS